MSDIRINMCGQLMTLTELRDELEENNESSVFIDYMESFFRHIEQQHEQIEKLQSQNKTQAESINGLLKKVKQYEDALKKNT